LGLQYLELIMLFYMLPMDYFCPRISSAHSAVLAAFRADFVKPGLIEKSFSDTFGEAFELRQTADYDMVITTDQEQASAVLDHAREFVDRITNYLEAAEKP